LRRRLAKRGRP